MYTIYCNIYVGLILLPTLVFNSCAQASHSPRPHMCSPTTFTQEEHSRLLAFSTVTVYVPASVSSASLMVRARIKPMTPGTILPGFSTTILPSFLQTTSRSLFNSQLKYNGCPLTTVTSSSSVFTKRTGSSVENFNQIRLKFSMK